MNTKDNLLDINKKLEYIGLDLNNIPEIFEKFEPLKYRPDRNYDDNTYKIYKYVNISDVKILLTPANRMSSITEKYTKAAPVKAYLDSESKDNIERYASFLSMLQKLDISKMEEIEKEQELLNKQIPFKVKYNKNYLWQIYYSEYTNQYFMLATTEDLDYSALFYLLKKQIENNKNEKIFVPISYMDYTKQYLKKSEINDLENYLWYFTREWPNIYEVFDKDENLSIQIIGKTVIYERIETDYRVKLDSIEESQKFYKLVKALFGLQTTLKHYYNFKINIGKKGELEFYNNNKLLKFSDLAEFVKAEYVKVCEEQNAISKDKLELENKLERVKKETAKLEKEYAMKERQIAAFLECKKSFFGRVKYFFNKKKSKEDLQVEDIQEKVVDQKKLFIVKKDYYTLEDLIYQYELLDKDTTYIKNVKMDIEAGEKRIQIIKVKVENAKQYLLEIDEHKKSLFEFWKFTNQDKMAQLVEGRDEKKEEHHLKKTFNYEIDFEDYSKKIDKIQRESLSNAEDESIYLLTTIARKDINLVEEQKEIAYNNLAKIKEEAFEKNKLLDEETFDIFGNFIMINNKTKTLDNKKHRENARDIAKILDISPKTELETYRAELEKVLTNINTAILKVKTDIEMPVYKMIDEEELTKEFYIFNINPVNAIKQIENKDYKKYILQKIVLNENSNILALTNSIYYDNAYQTLPLGMNISDGIIIKKSLLNLKVKGKENFNIIEYEQEGNDFSKFTVKKVEVIEYECI